jgi:hypothetical protein
MFWCLGMFSSASTWTFNVMQKIAVSLVPARPVIPVFVAHKLPELDEASGTVIVKSHVTDAGEELGRRAQAVIITIRDPRDAVASLISHNKAPFDVALDVTEATAWMCARFSAHPQGALFKFEDRFFDDPATVERIAAMFPGVLPKSESHRIFQELRRDAVEAFIANLPTLPTTQRNFDSVTGRWDTFDPATGWHEHHAGRKAEIGRWRRDLSDGQVLTIEQRMRPWMERFGYDAGAPRQEASYALRIGRYGITG